MVIKFSHLHQIIIILPHKIVQALLKGSITIFHLCQNNHQKLLRTDWIELYFTELSYSYCEENQCREGKLDQGQFALHFI
jgi:hypothetical protein